MNQRIKQLAIEANLISSESNGFDQTRLSIAQQKFAELIVQECATVIERNLFQGIGWNTSRAVKKHFGIEIEE